MNIQTNRLIIRPAIFDDFPFLLAFYNHKPNMQFIQSGKHDWTQNELLQKWDDLNKNRNIGLRVVLEKETGSVIGECGLLQLQENKTDHIEIGCMIDEEYWNKGYGIEITNAIINYAKSETKLTELKAGVNSSNIFSIRGLEKLGFKRIEEVKSKEKGIYFWYEIQL